MPKKPNLHNFIQPLKRRTLEPERARQMREVLSAYADLHSAPVRTGKYLSPLMPMLWSSRTWGVLAVMLVLLVGSSGVSFAAQGSLPGQPLYAVKVDVTEPIQGALALTPSARASWNTELVDRRLAEASELAAQGELTASTTAYIQTQLQNDVSKANAAATTLADSGDASAALDARTNLGARLSAHADVLALITPRLEASGDASTTASVLALLSDVQKTQGTIAAEGMGNAIAVAFAPAANGKHGSSSTGEVAISETTSVSGTSASSTETVQIALAAPMAKTAAPMMAPMSPADSLFRAHIEALLQALPAATTTASSTATTTTATSTTATSTVIEVTATSTSSQ